MAQGAEKPGERPAHIIVVVDNRERQYIGHVMLPIAYFRLISCRDLVGLTRERSKPYLCRPALADAADVLVDNRNSFDDAFAEGVLGHRFEYLFAHFVQHLVDRRVLQSVSNAIPHRLTNRSSNRRSFTMWASPVPNVERREPAAGAAGLSP